jgi:7-cyano-7-deazaguanine reductase
MNLPGDLHLGRAARYVDRYTPSLLQAIERRGLRRAGDGPFRGVDFWTAFELTWLNARGRPQAAVLELEVPCDSPGIVESKSLKLYLGSFTQTEFPSLRDVERTIARDLAVTVGAQVEVVVQGVEAFEERPVQRLPGVELDRIDVDCRHYRVAADLLRTDDTLVHETLHTHLLRTRCPVTGQPDHASVVIAYTGRAIDRPALLRYLVSFRDEACFHEQAVERIHADILRVCTPSSLSVTGLFTRRGGIAIAPLRTTEPDRPLQLRLRRQ